MTLEVKELTSEFAVAGQIELEHIQTLAERGFKTIICNRPETEGLGAEHHRIIADAITTAGMTFVYIPVTSSSLSDEYALKMATAIADSPAPTLAYCRSGTRSTVMWALGQALTEAQDIDTLEEIAERAGYDISAHLERFADEF